MYRSTRNRTSWHQHWALQGGRAQRRGTALLPDGPATSAASSYLHPAACTATGPPPYFPFYFPVSFHFYIPFYFLFTYVRLAVIPTLTIRTLVSPLTSEFAAICTPASSVESSNRTPACTPRQPFGTFRWKHWERN